MQLRYLMCPAEGNRQQETGPMFLFLGFQPRLEWRPRHLASALASVS